MKYERFLVALLAVCILMMPAFSVQDNGYPMSGQYDQQKTCDCQKPCDCQKSPYGEDGKQIGPKSMMGDDGKKIVCECKVMGKDGNQKTCDDQKSMMGDQGQYDQQKTCDCQKPCDCQKSPYGEDGKQIGPKSMMGDDGKKIVCECKVIGKDGHQKTCDDQKAMLGDQGQYNQQKTCDCQKSLYGEDGKQIGPKSMMGDDGKKIVCECKVIGKDGNQKTCDDQKSMMGDQGQYDQQKSCDCQKPCDCQKSPYGEDVKQIGIKSMMGNDGKKIVCLTVCKVIGKDDHQKTCDDQKSISEDQGQYGQQNTWNDSQKPALEDQSS